MLSQRLLSLLLSSPAVAALAVTGSNQQTNNLFNFNKVPLATRKSFGVRSPHGPLFRSRSIHPTPININAGDTSIASAVSTAMMMLASTSRDVDVNLPGAFWRGARSKYVVDFDWMLKGSLRRRIIGALKFFFLGGLLDLIKTLYALYFRKGISVTIHDARAQEKEEGLSKSEFFDKHGFVLLNHTSAMKANDWTESDRDMNDVLKAMNLNDNGEKYSKIMEEFRNGDTPAKRIYTKEAEDLIKSVLLPGRAKIVMPPAKGVRRYITRNLNKAPAKQVHNDYGLLFDEVVERNPAFDFKLQREKYEETNSNEYMLVNFWRPIKPMSTPCRSFPLCFLDSTTLSPDDFVAVDSFSLGIVTALKENPDHKFYYYPDMTVDEVVIFKQFHKIRNETVARMPVFHTAFDDPAADKTTEGRVSFEYRVGVLC